MTRAGSTQGPSWGNSKVNFERFFRKRGRFSPNVDQNVHERPPDTPTKGLLWQVLHQGPGCGLHHLLSLSLSLQHSVSLSLPLSVHPSLSLPLSPTLARWKERGRDREGGTQGEKERGRDRKKEREGKIEREKERGRDKERERERARETERERGRGTDRETLNPQPSSPRTARRGVGRGSLVLNLGPMPPSTLHPAPCTLHPAPCTLHPEPGSSARERRCWARRWGEAKAETSMYEAGSGANDAMFGAPRYTGTAPARVCV